MVLHVHIGMSINSTTGEVLSTWLRKAAKGPVDMARVTKDDDGLRLLMAASAWALAVDLAVALGYNDDETLISRKHKQVLALVRLQRYEEALISLGVVLGCTTVAPNTPQYIVFHLLRVEIYLALEDEREASIVVWELQGLAAQDCLQQPMVRLCVDLCAVKLLLVKGDLKSALAMLLRLLELELYTDPSCRVVLLCDILKVLLQMGGMQFCAHYQTLLRATLASNPQLGENRLAHLAAVTHASVVFAQGDYAAALESFEVCISRAAAALQRENSVAMAGPGLALLPTGEHAYFGMQDSSNLLLEAVNNASVCFLHSKQISEAVERLEGLVQSNPALFLQPVVIFNLCTMYDLSCTVELSDNKKRALHMLTKEYGVNTIPWTAFRITIS